MENWKQKLLFTVYYVPFTRKAFTLAEVLITLGILGVVIAMTIPGLMQNIQDRQFKEAAKEAFSKASQAVQMMKLDNGGDLSYYYITYAKFKPAFMQYFKIAQDCGNSNCVNSSTPYKDIAGDTDTSWPSYRCLQGQFITTDGMLFAMYNNGDTWNGYPYILITVDVNGYTKSPNVYGRDVFVFQLQNDVLSPMGGANTMYKVPGDCLKTTGWVEGGMAWGGIGCMEYVMEGKDY